MERALNGFIRALRVAGVDASTAEAIDAAKTLALVGYSDREHLRASFSVVLAKSATEKTIHDKVFDQYFSPPAPPKRDDEDGGEEQDADLTGDPEVDALLNMAGIGGSGAGGGQATAEARAALSRAATEAGVDDIRFASQTSYFVARTLDRLGIAPLEARLIQKLNENTPEAQAEAQMLSVARDVLQREARAVVDQRYELYGRQATEDFLTEVAMQRSLGSLGTADMPRMKIAVARMAKKLAIRHSRRQRQRLNGRLDLRRTLRANAGHDGVPFDLVFKYKRRDKPRIVAICDVSGSVSSYARFLLMFLHALHRNVTDLRAFAFSAELYDVEAPLARLDFEAAMAWILRECGSGSTDYGRAFADMSERHWDCIDRQTTVLVLGDGRSNNTDPRLDLFREMADRSKRVVWLCTEAERRWGTGDSCMLRYLPYCSHVSHCATIADLERAVDEVLQAYA